MKSPDYKDFLKILRPPGGGKTPLRANAGQLVDPESGARFKVRDGIPQLLDSQYDSQLAELYETQARDQKSEHSTVGYRIPFHYRRVHATFQTLFQHLQDGSFVADVGCGHGRMTKPLAARTTVFGIDLANNMLEIARSNGLIPIRASATALPFQDQSLDAVIAAEMVQHLENIHEFVSELARVTRPGGRILFSTINRGSIARRAHRLMRGMDLVEQARLRSASEFVAPVAGSPVAVDRVTWIMSPIPFEPGTRTTRFALSPLAQNYIISLVRN